MNNHPIDANQRFERWSDSYERSYMQWLIFDRVHRAVLNAVPAGWQPGAILDIGCGTGRLLRKVGRRWPKARLVGVDLAEGMIAQARTAMPKGEFYVASAESLPLPDASVDLVLSTMSFHHWQDQAQGVREVARVLRPGGRFYLADTCPPRWIMKVYHHGTMVYPPQLQAMFVQAGLNMLSQRHILGWFFYLSIGEKGNRG